jgi:crotonobetainyl-CoA:carnitine CoA-transferase CaiB-like acyl-CoA transferase
VVEDDDAIHGVYPCAGDDEWCVVSARGADDRVALAKVLGVTELPAAGVEFMAAVAAWTQLRDKAEVVDAIQDAGVPAGPMNRAVDVLADPQVAFRRLYVDMVHPLFAAPMPAETHAAPFQRIPDAALRPAPMPGEHTRAIVREVLNLDVDEIERLIGAGVLF